MHSPLFLYILTLSSCSSVISLIDLIDRKFGQRSSLVTSTTCLMYFVASRNHLHKFYFTMKLNVWEVYKMKVNNCVRIQDYWQEVINVKLSIFNSRQYIPLLKGYFLITYRIVSGHINIIWSVWSEFGSLPVMRIITVAVN